MSEATKQCPFCAETIQAAAVVCRHCGKDLLPKVVPNGSGGYSCSVCGGGVRKEATSCKHCNVVFGAAPTEAGAFVRAAPVTPATNPTRSIIPLVVIGVLLCIGVFIALSLGGRGAGTAAGVDPISAYVMCKQFVTDRLKAPATAVFPTFTDGSTRQLSAKQFRVSAFVDSQNGFGANVRTVYTCTVTNTGGNNWNLDGLTTVP